MLAMEALLSDTEGGGDLTAAGTTAGFDCSGSVLVGAGAEAGANFGDEGAVD